MSSDDATLCYAEETWAYFTTRTDGSQWGGDWNDAPHENNAGTPYTWREYMAKDGVPPDEIVKVAWDGPYTLPCENHMNSPWSVQQINARKVPWFAPCPYYGDNAEPIMAGTTLAEFRRAVMAAGGAVYERRPTDERP